MAGSQLSQLKAALTGAGLSRKSYSKKEKKAFKKGGARETDRAKTLKKLEDIRAGLNKFDQRETKLKHDVGGRQLKGTLGRPSASKQAGLDKRRKELLPEHQSRDHSGTFQDRRFGETNPDMSLEDRMLERYTRERQRGQGKQGLFNLDEGDELDDFGDGNMLGGLTHGGRSVLDLPGDDFVAQGLDEEDDEGIKAIDRRAVSRSHFGGFAEGEDDEELPERKKSKQEVMSEVIAKSKGYKAERQHQKDLDEDLRDELDEGLDDLRALLQEGPSDSSTYRPKAISHDNDAEYSQFVKTLAFEARAKPKDRTKTEDELAMEEKERLEEAEAKRLRRMRGEESDNEESGAKRRKVDSRREGDDLGDDFIDEDEEDLLGPGLTREVIEQGSGYSRTAKPERVAGGAEDDPADEETDEHEEEDGTDGGSRSDQDDEDDDDSAEGDSIDDDLDSAELDDLDDGYGGNSDEEEAEDLVRRSKPKATSRTAEIPYTFDCPESIDQFEDIMTSLEDSALPTVVHRIRAIHHPSLAQGNKERLQVFFGVLLDYVLLLASREDPAFDYITALTPHLVALVKLNPVTAAIHFIEKITLMQKNLARGLAKGPSNPHSRTLPGSPELVLLRLLGSIWSTSDFSHPVVAPAVLLMSQYLGHGRIRDLRDVASGLMLCSLLAQFEAESKRFSPEAINFLAASVTTLLPRRKDSVSTTPYPDLLAPSTELLLRSDVEAQDVVAFAEVMTSENDQSKANLLGLILRLIDTFAVMHSGSHAFIEAFQPLLDVLKASKSVKLSTGLQRRLTSTIQTLTRMLNLAITSRQPLTLQSHKPVPIASHAPRFEDDFAPGKRYDPDTERNAANKLKAQYKKERKGAIRELRKDNRFLAGEKAREQAEKDRSYNARMRKVEGSIHMERAEEKAMEREKAREKRRAGR